MASTDAPRRKTFAVTLGAEALAADTPYVLVDLSDTTNFPHDEANWINVLGLIFCAEKHSDCQSDFWVGVLTENNGTDGTAQWFHCFHFEHVANSTDATDRMHEVVDFTLGGGNPDGLRCEVSSGATPYLASNQTQADNANWINSTNRASPVGTSTKPGAGDIVVYAEEVNGGTVDFILTCVYETH